MRVYRLTHQLDPTEAFSGEGARRVAGRWHPLGVRVVYTASSVSLAVVENLVHFDAEDLDNIAWLYAVDLPDGALEVPHLSDLPADWSHPRRSHHARSYGAAWVASNRSLALAVPSVVVPQERNVLINPGHPSFPALSVGGATPFAFDRRLKTPVPPKTPRPPAILRRRRRR